MMTVHHFDDLAPDLPTEVSNIEAGCGLHVDPLALGRNGPIGVDSLVIENKVILDGSLMMHAPGKVARGLDVAKVREPPASAECHRIQWRAPYAGGMRTKP